MDDRPIGIIDSGIGGLTVVKEVINELPNESIIYLGDTARVPYGTRGNKIITQFALDLVQYLIDQNVKYIVVACNTISAVCLDEIVKFSKVPVLGVVEATVDEAVSKTLYKMGVIGTQATILSGIYEKKAKNLKKSIKVYKKACPLLVPLVEEGCLNDKFTLLIIQDYLKSIKDVDTLILGCTHYPLLKKSIQKIMGKKVLLVDSAKPTAQELKRQLTIMNLLSSGGSSQKYRFLVTDLPYRLHKTVGNLFDHKLPGKLEKITLENI